MDAGERAIIEDSRPSLAREEIYSAQDDHRRHERQCVLDHLIGELEREIGDDRLGARRRAQVFQKVNARFTVGTAIVDQVGRVDLARGGAQLLHDRAGASARFPNKTGNSLDREQCPHGSGRRLVAVITAHREPVPLRRSCSGILDLKITLICDRSRDK